MRSIHLSAFGLFLAATVLGGCASSMAKKASSEDRGCINTREINSIRPLDDEHVFVRVSASRHQLFTVDQPCPGLRLARAIVVADAARRVCGDGTTLIAFSYPAVGNVRCRIRRIEHVPDLATARELIEERASREE
jgi:hypothetical protein